MSDVVRIGAVADVHYGRDAEKRLRPLFEQVARQVDILLLGGDLTDFGLPEEAQVLARDIAKQFEEELTYPGQIKVTVIRESRATETAR